MRTFPSVKIFIQKLDHTIAVDTVPVLCLPDKPTLENVRTILQDGPLGDVERDIFFPSWTRSIHVMVLDPEKEKDYVPTWEEIDEGKVTVEDSEKLLEVLKKEEENAGTTSIILQECRSKRYTRKKENLTSLPFDTSTISSPGSSHPSSPKTSAGQNSSYAKPYRRQYGNQSTRTPQHEHYNNQANFEPGYYYDPYVPVRVFAQPSLYPPFYLPFQINGMGCYNYAPQPFVPQMYPGYYGYGVM